MCLRIVSRYRAPTILPTIRILVVFHHFMLIVGRVNNLFSHRQAGLAWEISFDTVIKIFNHRLNTINYYNNVIFYRKGCNEMDENNNNNMDQENGFVMRDSSVPQEDNQNTTEQQSAGSPQNTADTPKEEPRQDTTYRWSRPVQPEAADRQDMSGSQRFTGGPDMSENQGFADSQTSGYGSQDSSSDQVYRFQNTAPESDKREKKSSTMPKMIAGAVVFGVVAALCFAGVTALFRVFTGEGGSFSDSIGSTKDNSPVAVVSGAAATPYDVSGIVDRVMPAIVAITEKSTQRSYFGQTYSSTGAGSGFIVKQDSDQLLIVTNNHVVENADEISVQFNDGEVADAKVKGASASNDLAVITVDLNKLKDSTKKAIRVASLGSSDDAKVGQMVIAIGNALGYGQSVTVGYVSAKNREVSTSDGSGKTTTQILMQTDAAINPGNSGGALINTNGDVIGINSSKYMSYGTTNVEGMGYAIPMSDAVSIINELMDRQVLRDDERGYLGILGRNITDSVSRYYGIPVGVYVTSVSENGAAYKAGMKQGDVITKINGSTVKSIEAVQEIVNNTKVGTSIEVTIKRSDDGEYKEKKLTVVLKDKNTLDDLEEEPQSNNDNGYDYNGNGYGNDDSQIVPWGSSGY